MERDYGTKSYQPAKFRFNPLFSGSYNSEYQRLFDRLLPGNIMLSAYYSPVTIQELTLELGVPAAYLEDEVALLVRYGLLDRLPVGTRPGPGSPSGRDHYQTNMVIFTEEYMGELYEQLTPLCTQHLAELLSALRRQLASLRAIGFTGAQLEDDRLLWPLLWLVMHRGNTLAGQRVTAGCSYQPLYGDATGIIVGRAYTEEQDSPYHTYGFAGYSRIDDGCAAAFADFGILPPQNRYLRQDVQAVRDAVYAGTGEYVLFEQAQLSEVEHLLKPQIQAMADLYEQMIALSRTLLLNHAPQSVAGLVPDVIGKTLFFDTVGLLGKCALDSGALGLPQTDSPLAVFLYRTAP